MLEFEPHFFQSCYGIIISSCLVLILSVADHRTMSNLKSHRLYHPLRMWSKIYEIFRYRVQTGIQLMCRQGVQEEQNEVRMLVQIDTKADIPQH
jgi:hypothetical protein